MGSRGIHLIHAVLIEVHHARPRRRRDRIRLWEPTAAAGVVPVSGEDS